MFSHLWPGIHAFSVRLRKPLKSLIGPEKEIGWAQKMSSACRRGGFSRVQDKHRPFVRMRRQNITFVLISQFHHQTVDSSSVKLVTRMIGTGDGMTRTGDIQCPPQSTNCVHSLVHDIQARIAHQNFEIVDRLNHHVSC